MLTYVGGFEPQAYIFQDNDNNVIVVERLLMYSSTKSKGNKFVGYWNNNTGILTIQGLCTTDNYNNWICTFLTMKVKPVLNELKGSFSDTFYL